MSRNIFHHEVQKLDVVDLVLGDGLLDPVDVVGDLGVDPGVVGPGTTVSPADNTE